MSQLDAYRNYVKEADSSTPTCQQRIDYLRKSGKNKAANELEDALKKYNSMTPAEQNEQMEYDRKRRYCNTRISCSCRYCSCSSHDCTQYFKKIFLVFEHCYHYLKNISTYY